MKNAIAFLLLVVAMDSGTLANDIKTGVNIKLDTKAFRVLTNKLNRGETDLNLDDTAVLQNIDAIYREIPKGHSKEYYIEVMRDIAAEIRGQEYKTPVSYMLRSELQLLASYIVTRIDNIHSRDVNWKLIKELHDEATGNELKKTKEIFSQMVDLPYDQIKSISHLYFKAGEELTGEKAQTYGQLMAYITFPRTTQEKALSNKLIDEKEFRGASAYNLLSFSQVIRQPKRDINRIVIRRIYLANFSICFAKIIIHDKLLDNLENKNDIINLHESQAKWLLNEPLTSTIDRDMFDNCIFDYVKSKRVYKYDHNELYNDFISGFFE